MSLRRRMAFVAISGVVAGTVAQFADPSGSTGALVFLAPDLKAELGRVTLRNLGIFALRHPRASAGTEAVQMVIAELYCERMELRVGAAVA